MFSAVLEGVSACKDDVISPASRVDIVISSIVCFSLRITGMHVYATLLKRFRVLSKARYSNLPRTHHGTILYQCSARYTCTSMLSAGTQFQGESGKRYRIDTPLSSHKYCHVWSAVDEENENHHVVIKQPRHGDDKCHNWPSFQHEVRMQRRFRNAPFIRPMIDYIPACPKNQLPPKMVLQGFEKTLWTARLRRALTRDEIKWIMKDVLIGLWTIHREGLVHSGLS